MTTFCLTQRTTRRYKLESDTAKVPTSKNENPRLLWAPHKSTYLNSTILPQPKRFSNL